MREARRAYIDWSNFLYTTLHKIKVLFKKEQEKIYKTIKSSYLKAFAVFYLICYTTNYITFFQKWLKIDSRASFFWLFFSTFTKHLKYQYLVSFHINLYKLHNNAELNFKHITC